MMPRVEIVFIVLALSVFPELASTQSSLDITDIPDEFCSVVAGRHFKRLQSNTYDYFPGACKYYLANIELTSTGSHAVEVLLDTTSDEDVEITYIAIEDGVEAVRFRLTPDGVYQNNQNSTANLPVLLPQASVVEKGFYYILTDNSGIRIEYASGERLYLYIPENLVHRVDGLCGNDDAQSQNILGSGVGATPTFPALGNTYQHVSSDCTPVDALISPPENSISCNDHFANTSQFQDCGLDRSIYKGICDYEMYASPTNQSVDRGVCLALAEHYRMCSIVNGNAVDWRTSHDCVVSCPDGKVYVESGGQCPKTCEKSQLSEDCSDQGGVDGCDCPSEFFWNEETDSCVPKTDCFCIHDGTRYAKGDIADIECSTCECMGGSWNCLRNDTSCPGTCSITGKFLTTFNTFDGQLFQNTESCEHLLIEPLPATDNSAPSKTFQLSLGHTCSYGTPLCPPFVKLTIKDAGVSEVFRFHPDGRVRFRNLYMQLPFWGKIGVVVRNIMDNYLLVNTDFGLTIMWDWKSDLEIKASGSLRGKIFGMCGLFNGAINDELTLPTSEVTTDLILFGEKWRAVFCFLSKELTSYNLPQGICRLDAVFHLKVTARCDLMSKQPFHTCHSVVDPAKYISDCKTLGCTATTGDVFKNTCPSFAAYIEECARQGQIIAWAGSLECQPDCPVDRVLLHCPHTEHRMCSDHHVSIVGVEDKTCYPGCYCTPDKIFNDYSGECVEPDACPCITENHALKQPGSEFYLGCNLCTCHSGTYDCHSSNCTDCEYDQEYSSCACGKTCANQNSRICPEEGDEDCQGACECPAGTVLDEFNNECIAPEDCPCFHGNETFPVNTVSTRSDEMCLCKQGAFWQCIPLAPEGSCWAYGISSFNTYDDKTYSHNGKCSYVMSTDGCNENSTETFRVEVESLDCGEDPWACTKAVHISFPDVTVDLVRGAEPIIAPNTSKVCIRDVGGTYTMVRYEGLAITWDGANMVTITIEERFAEKVCGLCGNFDGRSDDDFLKQQGDTTRDVNEFVDSWATRDCLPAKTLSPECLNEVEEARRPWAESQCDIITSDVFSECHPYVSSTLYFDHCVHDAIKCYRGNGQDCMCDAVAAYAQKCIEKGICVDWREDHLCPVPCPCEDNRKYYACHSSCLTTCTYCPYEDKCITPKVEGCFCEGNLVDSNGTCVPPGHCYGKPGITTPTQPTQPPTTRPPTTQPPTTGPPTTQPPTTPSLPPTTPPPTTQPPTTPSLPPTTQPPTTPSLPPTTPPPTTQPPTTPSLPPSTPPPTTQPPTTPSLPPTTPPPTTQPPTTPSLPPTTPPPTTQPPTTPSLQPSTPPPTTQPPTTPSLPPTTPSPTTQPPTTPYLRPTTQPATTPPSTTAGPCRMAGDEICGTDIQGLYNSDSCVAPGDNYAVVAPSRECLITFSVPSKVNQLEIQVIDVVDADVIYTITCKDTTGKWSSAVDNNGTTINFSIPAGTGPNEVIREPLGSLAPHEVETIRIQFQPTGFSEFHIVTNFDVCTTIDYCVPKQPGCRFNGKFYNYGDNLPFNDSCVEMVCDEMMGLLATVKTCNLDCDGDLIYMDGQCCPDCVPAITVGCEVTYSNRTVNVGDLCRTVLPIAMGECAGLCSSSVDSMLDNSCTCCQVSQTTSIQALIECRDSEDAQSYRVNGLTNVVSISQCACQRCNPK